MRACVRDRLKEMGVERNSAFPAGKQVSIENAFITLFFLLFLFFSSSFKTKREKERKVERKWKRD